ncbi:unnamed protein product [Cyprideis torosa]|uniref:Uncharacterized protein n=1 Tax=Cyprideis torosa TaxID=163714 RepID=A0A7R8WQ25_9CRUS|nr:unnamed protein product [Cyprideis torosa]CAG0905556.1 unnamed protein product [Cyprideis torosa]
MSLLDRLDPWATIAKLGTHLIRLKSVRTTAQSEKETIQEICGNFFTRGSSLSRHNLKHSVEKPSGCMTGRKGYLSKSALQSHETKHSEGDESVCALCDQPFRLVEDLEKHLKWHIQGSSLV